MQNKTNSIKKWVAVGTMASGLMVAGWLYADDTTDASSICSSYTGGDGSSDCCDTSVKLLCQIDTDVNDGFKKVSDYLVQFLQNTTLFVDGYLKSVINNAGGTVAYIGNDDTRNNTTTAVTGAMEKQMKLDSGQQLVETKAFASKMPGVSGDNFNVNDFAISTLMNNPGIDANQKQQLELLIQTIAGAGNPVKNIDANKASDTSLVGVQEFLASLGSYNAVKSNAMNVLYGTMQYRTVQPGLGATVGVSQEISPMQMDMNSVNQALSFTKDDSFATASVLDMAKASYFVQVQSLYELHKLRQSMQQLNVTMAIMQLQMLNSVNKEDLDNLRQKATSS